MPGPHPPAGPEFGQQAAPGGPPTPGGPPAAPPSGSARMRQVADELDQLDELLRKRDGER
ncbi:hypothetical protein GL263_20930 [Streptomyces durbertensis]|uniref:Uncharacterized protein n=1 Tax=Streptomyces durbertensis TaxID=2448886 RepID=A0ABR6EL08_9ACTN|nr:hypothetical protein [Streptomyces durbertensis]